MPSFGKKSLALLDQAHPLIQTVMKEAIATAPDELDFSILCSVRDAADQQKAFDAGNSKARPGQSAHNYSPSLAVDILPYPFKNADWNDLPRWRKIGQHIMATAKRMKIPLRWGHDWNGDGNLFNDGKFVDAPHFELHPWREYK